MGEVLQRAVRFVHVAHSMKLRCNTWLSIDKNSEREHVLEGGDEGTFPRAYEIAVMLWTHPFGT